MKKIKLDLHDIYNKHREIESALRDILQEAKDKKVKIVEIIPGKGSGQLKKRVLKFLERNKNLYHRIDKDSKNWGRLFVRFKE
jgi:DNA-nicking Smr family endonuclease